MSKTLVILTVTGLHWANDKKIAKSWSAPSRTKLIEKLYKLTNEGLTGGSRLAQAANDLGFGAWQHSRSAPGFKRGTARVSLSIPIQI